MAGVAIGTMSASGAVVEQRADVGGVEVHYKVVLPDGFDASAEYPAVLVFGGGPQTMETVDGVLDRGFRQLAEERGYLVIAPAAPEDRLFFRGGDEIIPAFLEMILDRYNVRDGRFHVAGPSNGGIAAMHVAARFPAWFISATAFPGYLWQPTERKLDALAGICVFLYIGENDRYPWHAEMEREAAYLGGLGSKAHYNVEPGQPHRIATLAGESAGRLFDGFAQAADGCGPTAP